LVTKGSGGQKGLRRNKVFLLLVSGSFRRLPFDSFKEEVRSAEPKLLPLLLFFSWYILCLVYLLVRREAEPTASREFNPIKPSPCVNEAM
jgi:hypothetical protein